MITSSFLNIVVIGIVIIIGLMYHDTNVNDLIYVEAPKDGRKYLVRNLPDKDKAANMMSQNKGEFINNERLFKQA